MVRDFIMDEKYFSEYIQEDERRIEKFKNKLEANEVKEDRIFPVKRKIDAIQFGLFVAKYSAGYSLDELKEEFAILLKNMPLFWDNESSYIDMLWMMSIAVMLDVDKEAFSILSELVDKYNRNDSLLDFFIDYKLNNNTSGFKQKQKQQTIEPYAIIVDALQKGEMSVDVLNDYLNKKWYIGHKDMGWYEIHKAKEKLYNGYWSFEAGAIAKILNIDDSSLKDTPYYPYDLVHYK